MKKNILDFIKTFLIEIVSFLIAIIIFLQLLNVNFSRRLITIFDIFRPESTRVLFIVFLVLTITLVLLLLMQTRKKKLKSTMKQSTFSKTVERSHVIRKLSQTQVVYSAEPGVSGVKPAMPEDVDVTNPNVVELYFTYEEKLNI